MAKIMKFCEYRYAGKMIAEFTIKRNFAKRFGGDIAHFDRLITDWTKSRKTNFWD